jgi:hypothetical protein
MSSQKHVFDVARYFEPIPPFAADLTELDPQEAIPGSYVVVQKGTCVARVPVTLERVPACPVASVKRVQSEDQLGSGEHKEEAVKGFDLPSFFVSSEEKGLGVLSVREAV